MDKNQLIQKYNTEDAVAMIAPYPNKGELYAQGLSGLASYAKNIATNMKRPVIVYANRIGGQNTMYEEQGVLVIRCFTAGTSSMWRELYQSLRSLDKVRNMIIQFDFSIYGGMQTAGFVVPFLVLMRVRGYNVSLVLHQVVADVFSLSGHIGITNTFLGHSKGLIYKALFSMFYRSLVVATDTVVVLEEGLKSQLASFIPERKIVVIPHGVDTTLVAVTKQKARTFLSIPPDEHVVLFFGYVNWFKGADFFAKTFAGTRTFFGKKVRFIIAGGESPTMNKYAHYRQFYENTKKIVSSVSNIQITGYIPQDKIKYYFGAADLVVFPYRTFMVASGVMSLVFSYQKPFIVSDHLSDMLKVDGFKDAFAKTGLSIDKLVFKLSSLSLKHKTKQVLANGIKQQARNVSSLMRKERAYEKNAALYDQQLHKEVNTLHISPMRYFPSRIYATIQSVVNK